MPQGAMKLHTRTMAGKYVPMERIMKDIFVELEKKSDMPTHEQTVCKLEAGVLNFRSDWASRLER